MSSKEEWWVSYDVPATKNKPAGYWQVSIEPEKRNKSVS